MTAPLSSSIPGAREPHVARFWDTRPDGRVHCGLCPRHCTLGEGQAGFCAIRANQGGKLRLLGYGRPTAIQVDPIEKKPLSHFLPGTDVLSLGNAGCNLGCLFCQNWDISKARTDHRRSRDLAPEAVVALAKRYGCPTIAATYNEPVTWAEYAIDIAEAGRAQGLKSVAVTNGYLAPEAYDEFFGALDGANVDLKAFSDDFYGQITFAQRHPVLETLRHIARETEVWLELTTLLIPELNDGTDELKRAADWVLDNLGPDVPWHFTAFHPDYKLVSKPPTPPQTLHRARTIALAAGCRYVYTGNVHDAAGATTSCPGCQAPLIERDWHRVRTNLVTADGRCPHCRTEIAGRWR